MRACVCVCMFVYVFSATTSAETRLREAEEHFAKQEARLQTLLQEASTARSAAEKEAGELRAREDRIRQDMEVSHALGGVS